MSRREMLDSIGPVAVKNPKCAHERSEHCGAPGYLVHGANIVSFVRVARAMIALGLV